MQKLNTVLLRLEAIVQSIVEQVSPFSIVVPLLLVYIVRLLLIQELFQVLQT
jgi:hypothetical protein